MSSTRLEQLIDDVQAALNRCTTDIEVGLSVEDTALLQLRKACRLLAGAETLQAAYYTVVIEASFVSTERAVEFRLLERGTMQPDDLPDTHPGVYQEAAAAPVTDATVDVVISNCVVNLPRKKQRVFDDAYRVLKPGGRVAISDVVQTAPFPDDFKMEPDSLTGCVAGASTVDALEAIINSAGSEAIEIEPIDESAEFISDYDANRDLGDYLVSATIEARKPPRNA